MKRYLFLLLLVNWGSGVSANTSEPYYFEASWSHTGLYRNAFSACQDYFGAEKAYYSGGDAKLSGFRINRVSEAHYICSYDLSLPWGDFGGSVSVARKGGGCPFGMNWNSEVGSCVSDDLPPRCESSRGAHLML